MAGITGLNWHQQKELLKLRGKLSFRQFMGEKGKLLTAVTSVLILTPVMIGMAAATGAGYLLLPDQWPAQLLGFVLIISWLIWSIAPVLSFNVNEGLDPTRLLVYPVSRRDFLAHLLLGTLLDYPTYFFLPFIIAIVVGFGLGLALPVVLAAVILFYLLMILTSQTIINAVGGILRSRRFRDISIVIGAFFGMSCWLISTGMQEILPDVFDGSPEEFEQFLSTWQPLEIMKWAPPGAAAKAIEQAAAGEWGGAVVWLGYTLAWVALLGWLWWRVTYRIVTGEGFLVGGGVAANKDKDSKAGAKSARTPGFSWDWIPADIRSVAVKEIKVRWRTPQSRIGLIYMFLMPAFLVAYPLFFSPEENNDTPIVFGNVLITAGVVIYTMFVFWTNGQNMFGWETAGLPILLLTPISRQRLFFGKALAQFCMNGIPIVVLSIIAVIVQPGLVSLSLLPISIALGLASLSVLSVASVLFPYAVNVESQSGQNPFSGKGGCLTGLANTSLVPTGIGLVCLPVGLPLGLALWLEWDWLAPVVAVIGLIYGAVLFWFGTKLAGRLFIEREPEILLATTPKEK